MKKTLFLALVTVLTLLPLSCTKYDAPYTQPPTPPPAGTTAFTFTIYMSGDKIFLIEYNNINDPIHTTTIDNAEQNVPYSYAAQDNTVKIKVYICGDSYNWVQQVYYLEDGENIDIAISGNTIVGNHEP